MAVNTQSAGSGGRPYNVAGASGASVNLPSPEYTTNVLNLVKEAVREGDHFLSQQYGRDKIEQTIRLIMGEEALYHDTAQARSKELSDVCDNEFGSIAEHIAALMTDIKPFFQYKTKNAKFELQAVILGKLAEHWWRIEQIDQRFCDTIKLALAAGTGYLYTTWDPSKQDFVSEAKDARDVLPYRPRSAHSVQTWEGVIIREEKTVTELKARWPQHEALIRGERDLTSANDADKAMAAGASSMVQQSPFGRYKEFLSRAIAKFVGSSMPVCDLFTFYVKDRSRNESSSAVLMGPWSDDGTKKRANWAYRVEPGKPLYPRGRVIVCTNTVVLYDGPNNYWHGQFPITKVTLTPWPFPKAFLGKSPLWDIIDDQKSLNKTTRAIEDHIEKFVGPDIVYDSNAISKNAAKAIDPRKPRGLFARRPGPGKGVEFLQPTPLPAEVLARPQQIIDRMRSKTGVKDMEAIADLGQIPASETIEKMQDVTTGPTRARSRTLEAAIREIAMQMAYNFVQYYSIPQRLAILGADGLTVEDFDYDPDHLVPAHLGSDFTPTGDLRPELIVNGKAMTRPKEDRAREFLRYFVMDVTPGSLLSAAQLSERMAYLQFFRAGIMDPWTLYEKWGVANVGEAPNGARTITDRLQAAMGMGLIGQVSAAGRKSSGQQSPQMKSSGAISESG